MFDGRRYVLWGSAGHAKVLSEAISRVGRKMIALFDNSPTAAPVLSGVPLLGEFDAFCVWVKTQPEIHRIRGLVAIRGARGRDRLALQQMMMDHGLCGEPLVHPQAFVAATATLGPATQVLAMAVVAAEARVGAACIVNHKASVDHECELAEGVHIAPGVTLCACVTVEAFALIGAGAVVLPRLRIGRDSIVRAGSVVTRDVPAGVVVAGNPARVLRHVASTTGNL